jgi:ketosteroid isomerase-like protein
MNNRPWSRAFWSYVAVVMLMLGSGISALAQAPPVAASRSEASTDLAGIRAAAERFLRVLDDLDWELFRASWASEPTVFFPFADTPGRVAGKGAVETRWRQFFEEARRGPGPPYLNLKPLDLRVERYGDVGVVTLMLELNLGGRQLPLQRRTLIFIREHGAWKLAHMHASGASQS